jgi:predicted Fe-Mo cluster-binding NifX family protein
MKMKRMTFIVGLCLVIATSATIFGADRSRIAVASDGNTPASAVSPVAARSPYFLIFDGKGAFVEALINPHKNAGGGAGSLVVDFLAGKGAATIIAGAFGDKMIVAMKAKGMAYVVFKGIAGDAASQVVKRK